MAELQQLREKVQFYSKNTSLSQKLAIGVTLLVSVLVFVVILRWATRPDFALLFSNLDMKDAGQIVESLSSANVPYRLTAGGTTVMIPSKDVYEWRMNLASQGLPSSGGIGYEVFDKKDIGLSDFVQKVNFRRAIEGELARTIQRIDGIQEARVHIVIPQDRLFKADQHEPTASIVVNVRQNARLNENQVNGIIHLVAASVEGLEPSNVTIIDSRGNTLSNRYDTDSVVGLTSNQHALQREVEAALENKAQSMLATVLGTNSSIVRVSAELNFQRIEQTNERYDPDNTAVLSEERKNDTSSDSASETTGEMVYEITNYQVPKTIEHITNTVGNIQRLSVAVLVDGRRNKVTAADGTESWEYVPRTDEEMTTLSAVVKNAVGFDPLRNDLFEIRNVPFDVPEQMEEPAQAGFFSEPDRWFSWAQKIVPVIFLVVLLIFLRVKLKKIKINLPPVAPMQSYSQSGPSIEAIQVPRLDETASPEVIESAKLLKQIKDFAVEKPTLAARLLRYWMLEE